MGFRAHILNEKTRTFSDTSKTDRYKATHKKNGNHGTYI